MPHACFNVTVQGPLPDPQLSPCRATALHHLPSPGLCSFTCFYPSERIFCAAQTEPEPNLSHICVSSGQPEGSRGALESIRCLLG